MMKDQLLLLGCADTILVPRSRYICLEPTLGISMDPLDLQCYGCGKGIVGGRIGGWGIANEGVASMILSTGYFAQHDD